MYHPSSFLYVYDIHKPFFNLWSWLITYSGSPWIKSICHQDFRATYAVKMWGGISPLHSAWAWRLFSAVSIWALCSWDALLSSERLRRSNGGMARLLTVYQYTFFTLIIGCRSKTHLQGGSQNLQIEKPRKSQCGVAWMRAATQHLTYSDTFKELSWGWREHAKELLTLKGLKIGAVCVCVCVRTFARHISAGFEISCTTSAVRCLRILEVECQS